MRVSVVVAVGAVAVLLGVVGCASPGGQVTSPVPVEVVPAHERDALAAYDGMWRAFGEASRSANWQSPELPRFATGHALDQLVQGLQADKVLGVVTTGTYTTSPVVVSATPEGAPTVVRIQDCGDDSNTTRVRASNGEVLPGGESGRHRIEAEVRNEAGVWKVADFRLRAAGTC
ncbi:hypothetical protein [Pseudonocardia sp.]|uniref:hypothetical protein n=1 Tax=Pseudonocardia sp. TaxID=60912 RepID=UPI003D14F205